MENLYFMACVVLIYWSIINFFVFGILYMKMNDLLIKHENELIDKQFKTEVFKRIRNTIILSYVLIGVLLTIVIVHIIIKIVLL